MANEQKIKARISEDLLGWLNSQQGTPGFRAFVKLIDDDRKGATARALAPGDSDFAKGEAAALTGVLGLMDHLNRLANAGDTTDTPASGE